MLFVVAFFFNLKDTTCDHNLLEGEEVENWIATRGWQRGHSAKQPDQINSRRTAVSAVVCSKTAKSSHKSGWLTSCYVERK